MKGFASTLSLAASAALVRLAAGHGYVTNGTIGGTSYEFYQPYSDPYTSPTPDRISRPIQGNGPVEDITYSDLQCGGYTDGGVNGSSPAALHAPAEAGSDVTLYWTLWPDSHFGALVTYMARCPDTGCTDYMPDSDAVWFKIAESGLLDKATDSWAVDSLEVAGNAGYTYTIPECLASGYYLVRHEIIAVFLASTYPGVQIYPGCHQLEVTSSGSTTVSDLVSFPGAYSSTDPGIVWDSSSSTYPIPGPSVFSCDGSSGSTATSAASVATSTAAAAITSSAAASSSSAAAVVSSAATTSSAAATTSSVAATSAAATSAAVTSSTTAVAVEAASTSATSSTAAAATNSSAAASKSASCKKRRHARHLA
ncbi:putative Glycosyl hydrolase family 61-domain-containing protein [Seiridium cardinale]|uniref:lytic cellulose monooxygenase (C4-dehydrogenating) n=1 Tax=Seiridium cardinale TaxID=138064 RepID=A0ABR2XV15_9PEZI